MADVPVGRGPRSSRIAVLAVALPAGGKPVPGAPKCQIFPRSSHWNLRADRLPVHPRSNAIVSAIARAEHSYADFGSGLYEGVPIGIPYRVVSRSQRRVPVSFEYASESDCNRYPIPRNVPIEGGPRGDGDRHVILVDKSRCRLHELFSAYPLEGGRRWRASSTAMTGSTNGVMRSVCSA